MSLSPFDSDLYGKALSDHEIQTIFSDHTHIQKILNVESALAAVQGALGLIPQDAAAAIERCCHSIDISPEDLAVSTASNGVAIPGIVKAIRNTLGPSHAAYVHWGATSQDIHDTATILQLRAANAILRLRLKKTIDDLVALADRHRHTIMPGRTRSQYAVPISFGLKAANWAAPLIRHVKRLDQLEQRLYVLSLGGAAGTLSAMGAEAMAVEDALAKSLDLTVPLMPWHTQRDALAEYASWLSLVCGTLGKFASDIISLAQNDIGEISLKSGGGSSTMPQKSNPVRAETMISLAQYTAATVSVMHQALIHHHERSGSAWQSEWLTLPSLVAAGATSLAHSHAVLDNLTVNIDRMRENLNINNGTIYAEAAVFYLARRMSRPEAEAMVANACTRAQTEQRSLLDILAEESGDTEGFAALPHSAGLIGQASVFIDRVIKAAH